MSSLDRPLLSQGLGIALVIWLVIGLVLKLPTSAAAKAWVGEVVLVTLRVCGWVGLSVYTLERFNCCSYLHQSVDTQCTVVASHILTLRSKAQRSEYAASVTCMSIGLLEFSSCEFCSDESVANCLQAKRVGVSTIILPAENRKDYSDLPTFITDGLDIHFAQHYSDVYEIAMTNAGDRTRLHDKI